MCRSGPTVTTSVRISGGSFSGCRTSTLFLALVCDAVKNGVFTRGSSPATRHWRTYSRSRAMLSSTLLRRLASR